MQRSRATFAAFLSTPSSPWCSELSTALSLVTGAEMFNVNLYVKFFVATGAADLNTFNSDPRISSMIAVDVICNGNYNDDDVDAY